MIVVSAMIEIAQGKGDEYTAEFASLAPLVRKDPGCLTYVLHRMTREPGPLLRLRAVRGRGGHQTPRLHAALPRLPREDRAPRDGPRRRPLAGDRLNSLAAQRTPSPDGS
jgi:hypothetical protein